MSWSDGWSPWLIRPGVVAGAGGRAIAAGAFGRTLGGDR